MNGKMTFVTSYLSYAANNFYYFLHRIITMKRMEYAKTANAIQSAHLASHATYKLGDVSAEQEFLEIVVTLVLAHLRK